MERKREAQDFIEMMLKKVNSPEDNKPNTSSDADVKKIEKLTKGIIEGRIKREEKPRGTG